MIVTGPHNKIKALPKEKRKGSTIQDCWHEVPFVESSGFLGCFGLSLWAWVFWLRGCFVIGGFGILVVCLVFFVV